MVTRGSSVGALFKIQDGQLLTISKFREQQRLLQLINLKDIASALELQQQLPGQEIEDLKILKLGCWSISAYLGYVQNFKGGACPIE